ncbi:hypothetical protein E2C01_042273 [Portunus trituberculatus]|uniref:Uncharacterized protein n=1 Tax=Portunus trituberculatus TaxID=210409 RepID=A0A5B7FLD3_PORTR|nr:hypothetical protein [Portunus trituberculatus]
MSKVWRKTHTTHWNAGVQHYPARRGVEAQWCRKQTPLNPHCHQVNAKHTSHPRLYSRAPRRYRCTCCTPSIDLKPLSAARL